MKIALDSDDVVVDFTGRLLEVVNMEYGTQLRPQHIQEWDLSVLIDPIIGESWWSWWERRPWLWKTADAVPGAIGGIEILRREGHWVELVTAKPRWAEQVVWEWLARWRPPLHRVTIVPMGSNKAAYTDAQILVDDKPENCQQFADSGGEAILFHKNYNVAADFKPRAENWAEVLELIRRMG